MKVFIPLFAAMPLLARGDIVDIGLPNCTATQMADCAQNFGNATPTSCVQATMMAKNMIYCLGDEGCQFDCEVADGYVELVYPTCKDAVCSGAGAAAGAGTAAAALAAAAAVYLNT